MFVTVSSHMAIESALLISSSTLISWGKALSDVAEPLTGLSQPFNLVIRAALDWLVKYLRKSRTTSMCCVLGLTKNPSGAPSRTFGSPGAPEGTGILKKAQLFAMAADAPPLAVNTGNSTDSTYIIAALPARNVACADSWLRPLAFWVRQ